MQARVRKIASLKVDQFQESVIREMSRLASHHGAINLAQGLPDFPCPPQLKEAAAKALLDEINQYSITWGDKLLRDAIAKKASSDLGWNVDPEKHITVTCGATEAMVATMLAFFDPADEVIFFEPYYENYGPEALLVGAVPRYVSMHPPNWTFDERDLERAFTNKTRAIIVNTPHNPTGKVFTKEELECVARLCQKWGVLAFTDDIYEHILYDGAKHIAIGSLPGMEELTVTINSLSKTYSVTGWRVGWAIAASELTLAIRKVHDFLSVCAPAPLQRAGVVALNLTKKYYDELHDEYNCMRKHMLDTLDMIGIPYYKPGGAYYVFCDVSKMGLGSSLDFMKFLVEEIGVAVVPGGGFFGSSKIANNYVRFCFSRKMATLEEARQRLLKLSAKKS
jgi:aspartate/methionine/tyrosine aminotransferase